MPGIFVDPDEQFPITVHFQKIEDEDGNVVDVRVWSEEGDPPKDWESITAMFTSVDHDSFSEILEESTIINHMTGNPILRTKTLREQVLMKYMKSWDVGLDGEGGHEEDAVKPDLNAIGRTFFKVGNRLFLEFMNRAGMVDVVKKAMKEQRETDEVSGPQGRSMGPQIPSEMMGRPQIATPQQEGAPQPPPGFPPMSEIPQSEGR